jgi:hypothetical protein
LDGLGGHWQIELPGVSSVISLDCAGTSSARPPIMSAAALLQDSVELDGAGESLDSEHRLMQVLLERLATIPDDQRVAIAAAFYAQLGDDAPEDNAPWRNRYRKELRGGDDNLDRTRIEAALRAKRASRDG